MENSSMEAKDNFFARWASSIALLSLATASTQANVALRCCRCSRLLPADPSLSSPLKPLLEFQRPKLKFEVELQKVAENWDFIYSIVRPTAFFKSLGGQVELVKDGKPYLMFGDGKLCACKPITEADLASFIADCISCEDKINKILPIGGPGKALTPSKQDIENPKPPATTSSSFDAFLTDCGSNDFRSRPSSPIWPTQGAIARCCEELLPGGKWVLRDRAREALLCPLLEFGIL
ncbi:Divinyl chlorophyllide a 8-vinyl-reductase [Nymphaea thermarum]|nr:Divinyl chlorophyllide a 8-vinyl-reductase [Nymphaea thermarum]